MGMSQNKTFDFSGDELTKSGQPLTNPNKVWGDSQTHLKHFIGPPKKLD